MQKAVRRSWVGPVGLVCGILCIFNVGFAVCFDGPFRQGPLRDLCLWLSGMGFLFTGIATFLCGVLCLSRLESGKGSRLDGCVGVGGGCLLPLLVVCAIQIPSLLRSRMASNESATTGSLKAIATQQAIFKEQREVDQDGDGVGEYGYLCELSGEITPRNKKAKEPVSPVYISYRFRTGGSSGTGVAEKSGYFYRIYLLGRNGVGTDDTVCDGNDSTPSTPLDPKTDQAAIDKQEKHFVVYAWPVELNVTGQRCFFINEVGECYGTKMNKTTYSGTTGPAWNAAFKAKGMPYTISGRDAAWNPDSVDGNLWNPAG